MDSGDRLLRVASRSEARWGRRLSTTAAAFIIGTATLAQPSVASAQAALAPFCAPGQAPEFLLGLADLKARVGDPMGEPVECEHIDPDNGDVLQRTTTGLAYYRQRLNMPAFTTGVETWALSPRGRGLILWTGGGVEPPESTPAERQFYGQWLPILDRELEASGSVGDLDVVLRQGRYDEVDVAVVRKALADTRSVERDFAALQPPPRVVPGHRLWLERISEFGNFLELAMQALEQPDPAARKALVDESDRALDRSAQASRDANTALDAVMVREIDQLRRAGFTSMPGR